MTAIACLDMNNGIGKNGDLLISIPNDMAFFRETTKDSIVVMGRKTLFSFKNKEPLKNRINIVFTNNDNLKNEYNEYDNIFFIKDDNELDAIINLYKDKKVFLIGGATIYDKLINKCDTVLITRIYKEFDADTFFPSLDNFTKVNESQMFDYEDIKYQFITYKK